MKNELQEQTPPQLSRGEFLKAGVVLGATGPRLSADTLIPVLPNLRYSISLFQKVVDG